MSSGYKTYNAPKEGVGKQGEHSIKQALYVNGPFGQHVFHSNICYLAACKPIYPVLTCNLNITNKHTLILCDLEYPVQVIQSDLGNLMVRLRYLDGLTAITELVMSSLNGNLRNSDVVYLRNKTGKIHTCNKRILQVFIHIVSLPRHWHGNMCFQVSA
jgi:hypothetical protein